MRVKKQINIEIGEQLKAAREAARLTQEQFAEKIEVSPQYISDAERGVVGLSIATLKRACVALAVSSDQLLFGTTPEKRGDILAKKCAALTDAQFAILCEIAGKFAEAVAQQE